MLYVVSPAVRQRVYTVDLVVQLIECERMRAFAHPRVSIMLICAHAPPRSLPYFHAYMRRSATLCNATP